ncbi:TldD/PmbA family protein [Vibrio palustris]|uniref:Peptidase PmbA n=1 Tax=Vibrio palustris TaxID=1918946 RepID=A0A1R4B4Z2_9VIBR|nr:metallopeptidase TldD-related protein [Vibrio palustris]SJL83992.1 peptidase PmbA [Vibrio palustris]
MNQQDINNQAIDVLLEEASRQGAEADVVIRTSDSLGLSTYQGNVDRYEVANEREIGIRIIKDQKVATGCSESFESSDLKHMVKSLIDSLPYTKTSQHQRIVCAENDINDADDSINQVDDVSVEQKVNMVLSVEDALRQQRYVDNVTENEYFETNSLMVVANTLGTHCQHKERRLGCNSEVLCVNNDKQSMHHSLSLARCFDDIDTEFVIRHSTEIARELLGGAPVATGHYAVIFSVDELYNVFSAFCVAFSGKAAMQGITPLADKLGTSVAYGGFTLRDVPFQPQGMRIKAFDSEGFATQNTTMIQNGELRSLLHNSETASYFNTQTTGNAARMAALDVGHLHTVVDVGHHTVDDVQSGEYLELVALQGIHSGADVITGDFSFGASGFLCRDGQRIQPVRGITVAGNFYSMLKEIEAIGQVLESNMFQSFYAPKIRFARLSVGGK